MLYEGGNGDAPFSGEVQFFLDFLIVGLSPEEGLSRRRKSAPTGFVSKHAVLRLVRLVVWQSE